MSQQNERTHLHHHSFGKARTAQTMSARLSLCSNLAPLPEANTRATTDPREAGTGFRPRQAGPGDSLRFPSHTCARRSERPRPVPEHRAGGRSAERPGRCQRPWDSGRRRRLHVEKELGASQRTEPTLQRSLSISGLDSTSGKPRVSSVSDAPFGCRERL